MMTSWNHLSGMTSLVKRMMRTITLLTLVFVTGQLLMAQNTIRGTVTDATTGETLPGVNVIIQGTTTGTFTDIDGAFELEAPTLDGVLEFSFVGYQTLAEEINGRTEINVQLQMGVLAGEELVVVGYGAQTRETISGSVSSIDGPRMEQVPVTNLANSLTGNLPGIVTVNQSGEPGNDGAVIRIRGESTLNNNQPLIVIDGVPDRAGGLDRLNPRDIESVSILKDASAAIYGSRAANGVILITTKRGQAGAPRFSIDMNQGFNQPTRVPEMADAETYMTMLNELDSYRGLNERYSDAEIQCHAQQQDAWNCPDTDWFGEALKDLSTQSRVDMSVSGGSESIRYYVSFGALTEDGFYENSSTRYDEYSFRSNLDGQLSENVSLSIDLMGRLEDRNYPTESAGATFRMLMRGKPNEPAFWPNGLPAPDIENGTNPVVTGTDATGYDNDERYFFQSNAKLNIVVPQVEGLEFSGSIVYDQMFRDRKRWQTPWTLYDFAGFDDSGDPTFNESLVPNQDANLQQWADRGTNVLLNFIGTYQFDTDNHSFKFLLGSERQQIQNSGWNAYRRYFVSTKIDELSFGGEDNQSIGGGTSSLGNQLDFPNEAKRLNFFSRINYGYQSKYLIELIARYDGSYIFPEDNRFGFFPSASIAWRVSQEDWFTDATDIFDELKLRVSYGQTGNDRIEPFQFLNTYRNGGGYIIDDTPEPSISPGETPNDDVTWEVANQFNVGVEATLLDNSISVEADYFIENRTDILWYRNASVPRSAGISLPRENIGEVKAWGFDGSISWQNQFSSGLFLSVALNGGYATNEIVDWDEAPGAPEWQRSTGRMMNTGLYYRAIGIFKDQNEIDSYPTWPGARPGDVKFEDVNNDGVIDADDRVRVERTSLPKWNGGLTFSGQYQNFDFVIFFQGAAGASQYIRTQSGDFGNYIAEFADNRWTPANTNASQPRAFQRTEEYWMSENNTHFFFNTDYVRLKNVELGYNLPTGLTSTLGVDRMRVYANGFNLLTFSDFWLDPESRNASGSFYPQKRTFNLGLSVTF
jgi:TonB-linked SusC/RagA family outer membrane protein